MKRYLVWVIIPSLMFFPSGAYPYDDKGLLEDNKKLTLEMSINTALKNNTFIKSKKERLRAAGEEVKSSTSDFLPHLSTSYGYTRLNDEPFAKIGEVEFFMGTRDNYQWNFEVSQPLFTGFALKSKHQMAKLGVDMAELTTDQAILDIVKEVRVAYFKILLAQKFFLVAEEAVLQLQSHASDSEKMYQQGMVPYNDLLKSKVALADTVQNRVKSRSDLTFVTSSFNTILRIDIDEDTRVVDVLEFKPYDLSLGEAISTAIRKRPELSALRLLVKSSDWEINLAKSKHYPQIALVGNYERMGEDPDASKNNFGNSHNESVTVQLKWELFEWGKTKAEVRKYRFRKRALEEELIGIEDLVKLEVKKAYLDLKVASRNIETARESLTQAKENYRITNLQYQQQITTSTEVLDARTLLTQAQTNYFSALYGYNIARAELKRSMGTR